MKIRKIAIINTLFTLCWACSAIAQVEMIDKNASPLDVSVGLIYADKFNPTVAEDSSAYGIALKPKGKLVASSEGMLFMLDYEAKLQRYELRDEVALLAESQDFNSYRARVLSRFFLSDSWLVDIQAQHLSQTQQYGTGISRLQTNVLLADKLQQNREVITLVYGSDTSSRYISFKLASRDDKYADRNPYSAEFDVSQLSAAVEVAFRRSSLSRYMLKLEAQDSDYKSADRDDSKLYQGQFGMEWTPSGLSRLTLLVGMYRRQFVSKDASTGLSWHIEYNYRPRQDWLIEFSTARFSDVSKSDKTSDTVTVENKGSLTYLFSEQWTMAIKGSLARTDFATDDGNSQLDENGFGAQLNLHISDHSSVSLILNQEDISSDDNVLDYRQNEVRLDWRYNF